MVAWIIRSAVTEEPLRSRAMGLYLEEACKLEWRSVEPRKKRKLIA